MNEMKTLEFSRRYFQIASSVLVGDEHFYIDGEKIGQGGNCSVYKCTRERDSEEYAIKFLFKDYENNLVRFDQEIELLQKVQNDNLIKYISSGITELVEVIKPRKKKSVKFVIMELAECNLQSYMRSLNRALRFEEYIGQYKGLLLGLAELHKFAIHRDIKPENILIKGDKWLLSDFGLCKSLEVIMGDELDLTGDNEGIGPKFWMSPEALNSKLGSNDIITFQSDIFQLAAVFWYAATLRHPLGVLTSSDWKGPDGLYKILVSCLYSDSSKRPESANDFLIKLNESL